MFIHLIISPISFNFVWNFSCGPIFGAGADLLIANNCNTNMDSYSNLPHSYDGSNASNEVLFGDYNFTIIDYEVYTVAQTSETLSENPAYSSTANGFSTTSSNFTNSNGLSSGLNGSTNSMLSNNNLGNNSNSLGKDKYGRY